MSDIAVRVEGLGKRYQIGKQRHATIGDRFRALWTKSDQVDESEFWALKDVSFEIKKGEAVGIIGKNGAGKSTLLKVLSKITYPTTGRFEMNGRVSSLLEVGTGFHPELTGRENVFLNGTILGMTRSEIKSKFDEIVAFSGVEKFLDTPVKHYSSGMYVRLAFSVAAHLEPEILIIDEVLAVGDAEFQKRCLGKMGDVTKEGRTVLFVSHNMSAVKNLCSNGVLINSGELVIEGEVNSVIDHYMGSFQNDFDLNLVLETINRSNNIYVISNPKMPESAFEAKEVVVGFDISLLQSCKLLRINLSIVSLDDVVIMMIRNNMEENSMFEGSKYRISTSLPLQNFNKGVYKLVFSVDIPNEEIVTPPFELCKFEVIDNDLLIDKNRLWLGYILPTNFLEVSKYC